MRAFLVCKNELGEETLKAIGEAYNSDDDGIHLANCVRWLFLTLNLGLHREEIEYATS